MSASGRNGRDGGRRPETLATRVVPDCRHLVAVAREYLRQCWRQQCPVDLQSWFSAVPDLWHPVLAGHLLPVWLQFSWASYGEAATLRELEARWGGKWDADRIVQLHLRACRAGLAGQSGSPRAFRWARYYLRYLLGSGSHGVVYRAWDPLLGRDVAIKVGATEGAVSRSALWCEATLLGRVSGRASLPVYDLSCEGGLIWMVRRFVPGFNLGDLVGPGRRLSGGAAVRLARALLQHVATLHRCGVVHGDIWPANVLVTRGGSCELVDFCAGGEAGQVPSVAPSAPGEYLAPERRQPKALCDPRSDVYSLGVLLNRLLDEARRDQGAFGRAGSQTKRLMGAVAAIGERATAPDAALRYPTAGAMLAALRRAARA